MTWLMLALLVVLAVAAPLFGADTRDGLDWLRGHFWLPRTKRFRATGGPSSVLRPTEPDRPPRTTAAACGCP
jgi:hypothetical protein